jgi:hypothetical protein
VEEGVVALVSVEVLFGQVGHVLAKDAAVHVSVRLIDYNCHRR